MATPVSQPPAIDKHAPVLTLLLQVSLSNVVATTCQYEALRYLTFPLQTLAKCAKMIPVMLWGAAINRKTYSLQVGVHHVGFGEFIKKDN